MPPTAADAGTLLVVDMQRLVLDATDWQVPAARDIRPRVAALAAAFGPAAVFTRHVPPADGGHGSWRGFYERWRGLLSEDRLLEVPADLVPAGAAIVDKSVYSAFAPQLARLLEMGGSGSLVVCGVETDCCVQATVLDAVDAGWPVTVVEDAVASPDPAAHEGALAAWRRLPEQVALATSEQMLAGG